MQAAAAAGSNPYGLIPALQQGGIIAISTFAILVIMSLGTFYILFTKLMQQQKIISQGRKVRASFWNSANLREASTKLDPKSAYRAIVDDALLAQEQHSKLTDPIDQHDWIGNTLQRSQGSIGARLGEGLADRKGTLVEIGLQPVIGGAKPAKGKCDAMGIAAVLRPDRIEYRDAHIVHDMKIKETVEEADPPSGRTFRYPWVGPRVAGLEMLDDAAGLDHRRAVIQQQREQAERPVALQLLHIFRMLLVEQAIFERRAVSP